tara:strand:+ start:975 stop:1604 length:630 start_codon:yes stop_codon:yes gene_type:complete
LEKFLSLLVGLTGGMGTGKSLVASIFMELGAHILDADLICRKLVEPGQPALKEISECFGENILDKSMNLDRKKLAQIIFNDPDKKKILENILHPKVFAFEKEKYKKFCKINPSALVIIDAALLIESGNYKNMDKVVVVSTNKKNQMKRILARGGLPKDEIVSRINNQMPSQEKKRYADFILDNSSDKFELRNQVEDLYAKLAILAAKNQ